MSAARDPSAMSLPAKRARLAETLRQHSHRKILLGLESGVPEDTAWALNGLLIASCPPDNTNIIDRSVQPLGRDVLGDAVSLPRNPHLLRTLLPIAAPPPALYPDSARSALYPVAPGAAHTRALQLAQWRQAWLVLRNISLIGENEGPLAQSAMLRKLLLRTLRFAFRLYEGEPPLYAAELRELPGYDGLCRPTRENWLPVTTSTSQAGLLPPTSPLPGAPSYSSLAGLADDEAGAAETGAAVPNSVSAAISDANADADIALANGAASFAAPPPMLSVRHDNVAHAAASEVMSILCRGLRLDDVAAVLAPRRSSMFATGGAAGRDNKTGRPGVAGRRSPMSATSGTGTGAAGAGGAASGGGWQGEVSGGAEVCEVLSLMARCRDPALAGNAIEAIGRLSIVESNEAMVCQMATRHPSLLTALVTALAEVPGAAAAKAAAELTATSGGPDGGVAVGALEGGGGTTAINLPAHNLVQEGALEALIVLSAHGDKRIKRALLAERTLLPRLLKLLTPPAEKAATGMGDGRGKGRDQGPEPGVNLPRRAAQIMVNLCDCAEAHDALRQHEWALMHLAMHDAHGAAALASEVLEQLSER